VRVTRTLHSQTSRGAAERFTGDVHPTILPTAGGETTWGDHVTDEEYAGDRS